MPPTSAPPATAQKLAHWMKKNLFSSTGNSITTVILLCVILTWATSFFDWLIWNSVWAGDAQACRQAEGACLAFIREKFRFILFGFYPAELLWRPVVAMGLFVALAWWSWDLNRWNGHLVWKWLLLYTVGGVLLSGGILGMTPVSVDKWGGLCLTLMLASVGILLSYPLGILLALGRTGNLPFLRFLCVGYIELIRGVPLISLLFMASVMFPLFLPEGLILPKLVRVQLAIILFTAAYMAEIVRAGLAAIPKGQYEAADQLGLGYWQKTGLVILPQALKTVIPPTINMAISTFKDTSLVVIVSLHDLLMTTKLSLKDTNWLGFSIEAYLFVGMIYFVFCASMGIYSQYLETELNRGRVR